MGGVGGVIFRKTYSRRRVGLTIKKKVSKKIDAYFF